jgi:hypothetical protein
MKNSYEHGYYGKDDFRKLLCCTYERGICIKMQKGWKLCGKKNSVEDGKGKNASTYSPTRRRRRRRRRKEEEEHVDEPKLCTFQVYNPDDGVSTDLSNVVLL